MSFGHPPRDSSFNNLNIKSTIGQCNELGVRARCVVAEDVIAERIIASEIIIDPPIPPTPPTTPVVARAYLSNNIVGFGPGGTIIFDTEDVGNTAGIYNTATGQFTIPTTGRYVVYAHVTATTLAAIPPFLYGFSVQVNGGATNVGTATHSITGALPLVSLETEKIYWEVELQAGDVITVGAIFSGTATIVSGSGVATGATFAGVRQIL